MSTAVLPQLFYLSSVKEGRLLPLHLRLQSLSSITLHPRVVSAISHYGGMDSSRLRTQITLSYTGKGSSLKAYPIEERPTEDGMVEPKDEQVVQQKRAAKIHDFCLGIPFGSIVLCGGLFGFILSRSHATLITGVLFGGALLSLSTISLKVWRQGKSSLPFILGQAALSVALFLKNLQTYTLTKRIFPVCFYAFISAIMLCFYSYVVLSGGNPPPKKMKSSAVV